MRSGVPLICERRVVPRSDDVVFERRLGLRAVPVDGDERRSLGVAGVHLTAEARRPWLGKLPQRNHHLDDEKRIAQRGQRRTGPSSVTG
jgi:hypothetical protein